MEPDKTDYLDLMLSDLRNGQPFTLSRWGDGEWRAALRKEAPNRRNCDGHRYFSEMGHELREVLLSKPKYLMGMQPLAWRIYGNEIRRFLRDAELEDIPWVDGDVFHKGAIHGHMQEILDALKPRSVALVGPPHLKRLAPDRIAYQAFIDVPPKDAYNEISRIIRETGTVVRGMGPQVVVGLSCSMPAEIIIDRLHNEFLDQGHTFIDFGSLWDPLVGVNSRSYMRDPRIRRRIVS